MCEIDKYICVFQDYYYRIDSKERETYLEIFFSKILDSWGKKLREEYNSGSKDTLEKRIFHILDKLSKWCEESILFRKTRNLKYQLRLCCNNINMPTQIGCDTPYYYHKIKINIKSENILKENI